VIFLQHVDMKRGVELGHVSPLVITLRELRFDFSGKNFAFSGKKGKLVNF